MNPQGQNPPIPEYGSVSPPEEENQHEEPPPAYPQNRTQFEGYQNLGFVGPDGSIFHSQLNILFLLKLCSIDSQKNLPIPSDSNAPQPTFKE